MSLIESNNGNILEKVERKEEGFIDNDVMTNLKSVSSWIYSASQL